MKTLICLTLVALTACAQVERPRDEPTADQIRERIAQLQQRLHELEARGPDARPERPRAERPGDVRPETPRPDRPVEKPQRDPGASPERVKRPREGRGDVKPGGEMPNCPHCGQPMRKPGGDAAPVDREARKREALKSRGAEDLKRGSGREPGPGRDAPKPAPRDG